MANQNEELRKEDFEKAANVAKAKAADFRQQAVNGANSLRQQAASGLGALQETLKSEGGTSSSTLDSARNKGAELVGSAKGTVEPSTADKAKSTLQSVKEAVVPTAHAGTLTAEEQRQQARTHLSQAQDDMDKAGQHAASATQTVAHDLRSAADQAGQAASHLGHRFAASAHHARDTAVDKAGDAKESVREGLEQTEGEAKSLYASMKDTVSGWLGAKDHPTGEAKDDVDRAVERTEDAIARGAHKVQGAFLGAKDAAKDKAHETRARAPSAGEVKGEARSALDSAEYMAVRTKDAVVDTAKYIGGRLTAPIAGEGHHDSVEHKTRTAADKAGDHAKGMVDQARQAVGDAKDRLSQTADDAALRARKAADSVRPHSIEEAEKAEGLPPSNTARVRAEEFKTKAGDMRLSAHSTDARGALDTAEDMATRTKDAVVDTAKYIGGRLTAPIGGEGHHNAGDSVEHKTRGAMDKAGDQAKGMVDQARQAVGDAKERLVQAADEAAQRAREAADSVRPHSIEEAEKAEGLPPSNTADILAERASATDSHPSHDADSLASKVADAWGGENLSGDSDLASVRAGLNRRG